MIPGPTWRRGRPVSERLTIDYFSDVLCVWAWISQRRIDEMTAQWGDTVDVRYHCMDVFGDAAAKVAANWKARGGYEGFAEHVREVADRFDAPSVHADLWVRVRPATSGIAHLVLKATEIVASADLMNRLARALREAFFIDGRNVGELDVCLEVAQALDVDRASLEAQLTSGKALAALLSDYRLAQEQGIRGSPSWVMNEGRQVLYGNVGYRILNANIEELLRHPEQEASWC